MHGHWLLWLEQQRKLGTISKLKPSDELHPGGCIRLKIKKREYEYRGEVDMVGNASGFGTATCTSWDYRGEVLKGTFLNNKPHGLGE